MEFKDLIASRRSIRSYEDTPVDHETLVSILKQAQQAPSWKNWQASRSYVVESPEKLAELREKGLPPFNQKNSTNAALIVSTFVRDTIAFTNGEPDDACGNEWGAYDLGLHDAYLLLAAADAGLSTLVMGIRDTAAIREVLSIPENEEILSVIAVGKAAGEPADRPRKSLEEVAKFY